MNNFFKVGDKVRILDGSKNKSYCGGWASAMNAYVGKTDIIRALSEHGVFLLGNVFTWDTRYLELVEERKMENKIIIDGKEYNLSDELIKKIKEEIKEQDKPAFERNNKYYFIGPDGLVSSRKDCNDLMIDGARYAVANYCTNGELIQQRAWHEILNRQLWRYAEERNKNLPWDGIQLHYAICYDYQDQGFTVDGFYISKYDGTIYFDYKKDAVLAIEEVVKPFMAKHHQFVW